MQFFWCRLTDRLVQPHSLYNFTNDTDLISRYLNTPILSIYSKAVLTSDIVLFHACFNVYTIYQNANVFEVNTNEKTL